LKISGNEKLDTTSFLQIQIKLSRMGVLEKIKKPPIINFLEKVFWMYLKENGISQCPKQAFL
jgi:hypothetical protein